ncbi:hypothetical protein HPP92_023742 [Vanilla planifolia]|uniref:RING-CH-type domain-containing protein n=1 Tax=Vanilla planifolia TaxID=51239 RepID=A0A835PQM0_VANPL|nr:hypothetical protein HPP92_023742 [Vanilla planifolia]
MNATQYNSQDEVKNSRDSDPLLEKRDDPCKDNSDEIREEDDLESDSQACCRICLESGDELISPCMCKGTQQFVHRSCLDHWRAVKARFAFSHCTTCKAQYHLRVELLDNHSWQKMKFRIFVARDIFLVFLAVQAVRNSLRYLVLLPMFWIEMGALGTLLLMVGMAFCQSIQCHSTIVQELWPFSCCWGLWA